MKKVIKIAFFLLFAFSIYLPCNVWAEEKNTVTLGGEPFSVKLFCDGVLVIGTQIVQNENPAEDAGIKQNDIITFANGEKIISNEQLQEIIEDSGGEELSLTIKRGEESIYTTLYPEEDPQGNYKAGMWIRDSAAGIGTITFYSQDLEGFCGLGHGICDKDTGTLMPLATGDVDISYITSVTKSTDGCVGKLNGYFQDYDIGTALSNNENGLYGTMTKQKETGQIIEIGTKSEVQTGPALVYSTIEGSVPKSYNAEIININEENTTRNLVIRITDETLLDKTGGIVQGMSGSPIVQNGKLVGAVTHVMIDNVEYGYGIFAENMLRELEETCKNMS